MEKISLPPARSYTSPPTLHSGEARLTGATESRFIFPSANSPHLPYPKGPETRLIDIPREISNPLLRTTWHLVKRPVESILGIPRLNEGYERLLQRNGNEEDFFSAVLRVHEMNYSLSGTPLEDIPRTGPLFVVSNHPFGGVDGVILGAILQKIRPDFKLIANALLCRIEGILPWLFPVNPFGGKKAACENRNAMRAALRHLEEGGCLATFPSGEVSHFHWRGAHVVDPAWKPHIARMVRKAGATVLPVFIHGKNSMLFQCLGALSARARTALLLREMADARGKQFHVHIGNPIPFAKLKGFKTDEAMTEFLRMGTYALQNGVKAPPPKPLIPRRIPAAPVQEPIIAPVPPERIRAEIESLPEYARLAGNDTFSVHLFHGETLPHTLRELGRLRETTFRAVSEGTGKSCDLDAFDAYYDHLVLYDHKEGQIVGAYRLGCTDNILEKFGQSGLYTSTLFRFQPAFFDRLNSAIELGRSFIRAEYQNHLACLPLLWRGIAGYMIRHPQCVKLFGPVSINPKYHAFSRRLMVEFLIKNSIAADLAPLVRARRPPRRIDLCGVDIARLLEANFDMENLSAVVSGLEQDNKSVPVLLKHYLKLNGQLISFNVDASFGECLDGLIVVDIFKIPRRTLNAYMGVETAEQYLRHHAQE